MIRKFSVNRMLQIGLILSQLLPGTLLTVEAAQLLYENTFEDRWGDISYELTPQPVPACWLSQKFTRVDDPVGTTNKVARVFQSGDGSCLDSTGKHRAQIRADDPNGDAIEINQYGVDYFFGVRFYIEKFDHAYYQLNGFNHSFWNVKTSSARESRMELRGKNGQPSLRVQAKYTNNGNDVDVGEVDFSVPAGEWVNLIIQLRRTTDNTGILKVWRNGSLVVNFVNVRTATDPSQVRFGPYTRFGTYWGEQNRPDAIVYFDDWRIATGTGGFDLVNPSNVSVPTAAPPTAPTNLQLSNN